MSNIIGKALNLLDQIKAPAGVSELTHGADSWYAEYSSLQVGRCLKCREILKHIRSMINRAESVGVSLEQIRYLRSAEQAAVDFLNRNNVSTDGRVVDLASPSGDEILKESCSPSTTEMGCSPGTRSSCQKSKKRLLSENMNESKTDCADVMNGPIFTPLRSESKKFKRLPTGLQHSKVHSVVDFTVNLSPKKKQSKLDDMFPQVGKRSESKVVIQVGNSVNSKVSTNERLSVSVPTNMSPDGCLEVKNGHLANKSLVIKEGLNKAKQVLMPVQRVSPSKSVISGSSSKKFNTPRVLRSTPRSQENRPQQRKAIPGTPSRRRLEYATDPGVKVVRPFQFQETSPGSGYNAAELSPPNSVGTQLKANSNPGSKLQEKSSKSLNYPKSLKTHSVSMAKVRGSWPRRSRGFSGAASHGAANFKIIVISEKMACECGATVKYRDALAEDRPGLLLREEIVISSGQMYLGNIHDVDAMMLECKLCGDLVHALDHEAHALAHAGKRVYECGFCGYKFTTCSIVAVQEHCAVVHGKVRFYRSFTFDQEFEIFQQKVECGFS